jgi:hypothetical protein
VLTGRLLAAGDAGIFEGACYVICGGEMGYDTDAVGVELVVRPG